MLLKYTLTGKQLYDFQFTFAKHIAAKTPLNWLRQLLSYTSIAVFGALCVLFAASWEQAFFLWWLSLVLVVFVNLLLRKITARAYARYYEKLPGALDWEHRVVDGRLVTASRNVETSFPIDSTAALSKDKEFLYIDFNERGRVRILLSAFASGAQLAEFEGLFAKPSTPNQQPEPTRMDDRSAI